MVPRRAFLVGSASLPLAASQASDKTRTAFIGAGNRGSGLLAGVLQQAAASVAALCDNKPERLDKAASAAARDNPATTTDWRRIIDRKDVDAVFIATPPHLHAEMAVAALQAGKHVYCEKPIGITPQQVRDVLRAARSSARVFTSGQQLRSVSVYAEAVRKIREGAIGDVIMVKAQRHATADLAHDGSSGDWYFDVAKSGGYLIEQSVHNLDLCNWAIGAAPLRATGLGAIVMYKDQPPGRSIFDCGSLTYDYPGGVKMSFTQNVFHPRGLPAGGQSIYVYGNRGALDLMGQGPATFYPLAPGAAPVVLAERRQDNPHAHISAFYACIQSGGPNPAGVEIGATAALTAILGHLAMTQEKVVSWKDLGVAI